MKKLILNEEAIKKIINNKLISIKNSKSKIKKLYTLKESLLKEIGEVKVILQRRTCKEEEVKKLFERIKNIDTNIDIDSLNKEIVSLKKALVQTIEYNRLNECLQQYRSTEESELSRKKDILSKLWKKIPKQVCVEQRELKKLYYREISIQSKYKERFEALDAYDHDEKINTIQTLLNDVRISKQVMKCPKCKSNLVLKDKKLHLSDLECKDVEYDEKQLESDLKREREKRKVYESIKHDLQGSEKTISNIKEKLIDYYFNLDEYYTSNMELETELNKINVERYTSLRSATEKKLSLLTSSLNETEDKIRDKIVVLEHKKKGLLLEIKEKELYDKERLELEEITKINVREVSVIESELNETNVNINHIEQQLERNTVELRKLEEYLTFLKQTLEIKSVDKDLSSLRNDEKLYTEEYNAAKLFKEKISEAESLFISELISSINTHAGIYLDLFFTDDPISVELCPFKETKHEKKPQINVQIKYKGMEIDLSALSGGESDRVYLAYTLALSEIFNTCLILLDECLSSLDQDNVYNVLHGMKDTQSNKLVLIVAHNFITGNFDQTIEL